MVDGSMRKQQPITAIERTFFCPLELFFFRSRCCSWLRSRVFLCVRSNERESSRNPQQIDFGISFFSFAWTVTAQVGLGCLVGRSMRQQQPTTTKLTHVFPGLKDFFLSLPLLLVVVLPRVLRVCAQTNANRIETP